MFDDGAYAGTAWRLVEAQHIVSTTKLVDTAEEQALLEDVIEAAKPPVPPQCQHLHYLLSTPFRYGAPYPRGSRFRRAGHTDGVWYGSEEVETAIYNGDDLAEGDRITGPAIVEFATTTVVVNPEDVLTVQADGSSLLTIAL